MTDCLLLTFSKDGPRSRRWSSVTLLSSAGVIAVVIFVVLSALAVMARVLYRRKGTFQSQEVKTVKPEDGPELAFGGSQNGPSEHQKEYFI